MKLVALLSGGIDSPVAAYRMLKSGAALVLAHFHLQTQASEEVKRKILDLAKVLSRHGKVKLYLVPFGDVQRELIKVVPAQYRMIVYRRYMFKLAEIVLEKEKADGFVTGDSVGQVASQTLDNLRVIWSATHQLILAPLIGDNKEETIELAKKIKTYDISVQPYEDCCSFMNAKHPETHANLEQVELIEKGVKQLKLDKIVERAEIKSY